MNKKKYFVGEIISSIEELNKQQYIYYCIPAHKPKLLHSGFWGSWQLITIRRYLRKGMIRYAIEDIEEQRIEIIKKQLFTDFSNRINKVSLSLVNGVKMIPIAEVQKIIDNMIWRKK